MSKHPEYVVLTVVDGSNERSTPFYRPQLAMAHWFSSPEAAAVANVGTYPEAHEKGNNPYKRVVVIPWEHWQVFDVYVESIKGEEKFVAYPTENQPIRARSEAPEMD